MALPVRSKNPPETFPAATIALLVVNLLAFAFTVDSNLHIREEVWRALAVSWSGFAPHKLITHLFLHGGLLHLLANLWFLYLFGFSVEGRLRTWKFLGVYFASGIFGAAVHLLLFGWRTPDVPMLGASGAIYGVMGAALYLFPHSQVQFVWGLFGFRSATWSMAWVALYYLALDVLFAVRAGGSDGVAHFAHIGGLLCGFALCALLKPRRDDKQTSDAKALYVDQKDDLTLLSSAELGTLSELRPEDTTIVLRWMHRNIRDVKIKPDCERAFRRLLPQILEREHAADVAMVLLALTTVRDWIRNEHLVYVAFKLEGMDEIQLALRLYDVVLKRENSPASDIQSALFRTALLSEKTPDDRPRAVQMYQQLIDDHPMTPMAEQAKVRLKMLVR